jgi:hypothetical protein
MKQRPKDNELMNVERLKEKFLHDQSVMQNALPMFPQDDEYYDQFGEEANQIAGDYSDRNYGAGRTRIGGYILDLYRMTPDIPDVAVSALDRDLRREIS